MMSTYPENDETVSIPRPEFGVDSHSKITLTMVETHAWSVAGVTLSYEINHNGWSRWIGTYEEYVSMMVKVVTKVTKKLATFPSPPPRPTFISREVFAPLLWDFGRYDEKSTLSGRDLAKIHLLTEQALSGYLILCAKASPGHLTSEAMKEHYWLPVVQLLEAGEGAPLPAALPPDYGSRRAGDEGLDESSESPRVSRQRYIVVCTLPREDRGDGVLNLGIGVLGHYATKKEAIRDICGALGSLSSTQLRESIRELLSSGTLAARDQKVWSILEVNDQPVEVDESPEFDDIYQEEAGPLRHETC